MDEMQYYELADIMDNLGFTDRNGWEQSRIIAYYIALKMVKKKLNFKDVLPLPFDKNNDREPDIDIELINKQAKKLEDFLNKKQ